MFQSILEFMGVGGNIVSHVQTLEIAQKLLHQGLKRAELRDELYMQLLKQTRGNPTAATKLKAWQLFSLVSACMAPSKDFTGLIGEYVHGVTMEEEEDKAVKELAGKAWQALKRTAKAGPRRTVRGVSCQLPCLPHFTMQRTRLFSKLVFDTVPPFCARSCPRWRRSTPSCTQRS